MNRAAEKAAPQAKAIFIDAISPDDRRGRPEDPRRQQHRRYEYFKAKTSGSCMKLSSQSCRPA